LNKLPPSAAVAALPFFFVLIFGSGRRKVEKKRERSDLRAAGTYTGATMPTPLQLQTIRQTYPRAYQPWAPADDLLLEEQYREGAEIDELAQSLGRQPSAIRSRLVKLEILEENAPTTTDLEPEPTPISLPPPPTNPVDYSRILPPDSPILTNNFSVPGAQAIPNNPGLPMLAASNIDTPSAGCAIIEHDLQ
jgi:hypothetical protein